MSSRAPLPPPGSNAADAYATGLGCGLLLTLLFGILSIGWRLVAWMYLKFPLGFGIILAIWAWILISSPDDGGIDSAAFAPWMFIAAAGCVVWQIVKWRGEFG